MIVQLWGGPLDGEEMDFDEPTPNMEIPLLERWPIEHAEDRDQPLRRHHYVFDRGSRRYNYAGDWG